MKDPCERGRALKLQLDNNYEMEYIYSFYSKAVSEDPAFPQHWLTGNWRGEIILYRLMVHFSFENKYHLGEQTHSYSLFSNTTWIYVHSGGMIKLNEPVSEFTCFKIRK